MDRWIAERSLASTGPDTRNQRHGIQIREACREPVLVDELPEGRQIVRGMAREEGRAEAMKAPHGAEQVDIGRA